MGARSGDLDFARYFNRFFEEVLYPYMKENDIEIIIQLGDYFDNQNSVDTSAWKECKPVWVDKLNDHGFKMIVLVGNHDIAYRNTLRVNTPELILSEYEHIQILKEPMSLCLDRSGYSFDIVPWICQENREEILAFIEKQESPVLIGHFAIEGFPFHKGGMVDKKGLSRSLFENYPFVFSGHYHTKSSSNNIDYLGIPYEITWSDFGDTKGFHVFDTEKQILEFIPNPITMFEKIVYEDDINLDDYDLDGKIVKLIVKNRMDLKKYNSFLEQLRSLKLKELSIQEQIEDVSKVSDIEVDEIDWVQDQTVYIKKAVEVTTTDLNKEDISEYLCSLHARAIAL